MPSGKEHSLKIVEEFLGGRFISEGAVKNSCSVCGYVESTAPVGVIIKWLGYSVPEFSNGGTVGIAQGFCVDGKELLAYTNATGKNVEYGVVAAVGTKVNPIGFDGGATTVVSGAIKVDLTGVFCCEIKLAGITDENYDKLLVFSGYISDTEQVTYINNGAATQSAIAVSYNQILNLSDGIVK